MESRSVSSRDKRRPLKRQPAQKKEEKKKQLELSFLEILQMNSHANTLILSFFTLETNMVKKKKKMYCNLDKTFQWELYVWQMSGCMGLNCLPVLREIYRITLSSGQLPG